MPRLGLLHHGLFFFVDDHLIQQLACALPAQKVQHAEDDEQYSLL